MVLSVAVVFALRGVVVILCSSAPRLVLIVRSLRHGPPVRLSALQGRPNCVQPFGVEVALVGGK